MYKLSKASLKELESCDIRLQLIVKKLITITPLDFVVFEGARSVEEARQNFKSGASKLDPDKGEFSKHIVGKVEKNGKVLLDRQYSLAVDLVPYNKKTEWDFEKAKVIAGMFLAIASEMGIEIRWGGGWNLHKGSNSLNTKDDLQDDWHFEIVG